MKVFLGTVGILALFDLDDQWHLDAEKAYQRIVQEKMVMVTTELVLFECGNAAARRPYRNDVFELKTGWPRVVVCWLCQMMKKAWPGIIFRLDCLGMPGSLTMFRLWS